MKKLFYKLPETVGEELKAQIKYRICIEKNRTDIEKVDKILNDSDLSIRVRKSQIDLFEFKRMDYDEFTSRPAIISNLKRITINEQIKDYINLFCTFKVLDIIKEDTNIIQLLDYYKIFPKKETEKNRLEEFKNRNNQHCLSMCCKCKNIEQRLCENYNKCLFRKIKEKLNNIVDKDEKIKLLYKLGFPSNWLDIINVLNLNSYNIYLQALKDILEVLKMCNELEFVNFLEENYNKNFIKIIKDSKADWRDEIQEQKTKIKKLKDTKDIKELQELIEEERELEIINGYLKKSSNTEFEKIRPHYFSRIEDECYMKPKIPEKTIH